MKFGLNGRWDKRSPARVRGLGKEKKTNRGENGRPERKGKSQRRIPRGKSGPGERPATIIARPESGKAPAREGSVPRKQDLRQMA